jgi:hypothetical protein
MPNRHPHLARRTGYVFILWADKFEEAEAAIFARLSLMEGRISTYTKIDDLGEFARDIAGSLSSTVVDR